MRHLTWITALASLLVGACRSSAGSAPVAGLATPEAAVAAYFRAGDEHRSRLVRAAFDPGTPIQWVDPDGTPRALTQIEWWPKLDGPGGGPAASRSQRTLDRSGDLALVEAVSRWDSHGFDDLLLVVRFPGAGWRIVGKVFVRLAPGESAAAADGDEPAIRAVLEQKIAAHAEYDPALLLASHLPGCRYAHVDGTSVGLSTLSEAGARYAARRDAGETDHDSPWRILDVVVRGPIAAAKLDVKWQGRRHVDHLLLVRTAVGWKIAAAAWGPAES